MAVEIFHTVESGPGSGWTIEKAMGRTREAKAGVLSAANARAKRAHAVLNTAKKRTGSSSIIVEPSAKSSDVLVTLTDTRGQGAANIIEFGRAPKNPNSSPSYAVAPLRKAFRHGAKQYKRKGR